MRGCADQRRPDNFAAAGKELQDIPRNAGLPERFAEAAGDGGGLLGGFDDGGVAGDQRGDGHAGADRERKIPRGDDRGHAARFVEDEVGFAGEMAGAGGACGVNRGGARWA